MTTPRRTSEEANHQQLYWLNQILPTINGGSAPGDNLYSPERQRSLTHRWAPETDLQWGPRHLESHRGKTPGTSGPLILWLWCSWNKLLVRLAPRLSLVSPKVFSPFCHRWSLGSLPLSPLACVVGESSFPAISSTWLNRYYLNWTELDDGITKFNNEMPSAEFQILSFYIIDTIFLFWYCAVLCYNLYC